MASKRSKLLSRLKALNDDFEHQKELETGMKDEQSKGQTPDQVKMGLPAMLQQLNQRRRQQKEARVQAAGSSGSSGSSDSNDAKSKRLKDYLVTSAVEKKIIRQVEYYFGDHNLPRDRFMKEVMEANNGWIPIDIMLTFKRLSDLSRDADLVMNALDKSENGILQVDFCGRQIRRHPDNPLPDLDEANRLDILERTVFVAGFDSQTTLDDLLNFFEGGHDKVCNIRMRFHRTTLEPNNNNLAEEKEDRTFIGSVFVTFADVEAAEFFLKLAKREPGLRFQGRKLHAKFQKEFLAQKVEDNDEFHEDKIDRTVFIQGFDKVDTGDEELADFFAQFNGAEMVRKRVYRDNASRDDNEGVWRFTGAVFVCFTSEETAQHFYRLLEKQPLSYKGDRLNVKWQSDFFLQKGKFRRDMRKWKERRQTQEL